MKFVLVVAILWSASCCQADITTDMKAELDEMKATLNSIQAVVSLLAREHLESAVDDRVSGNFVRTSTCASGTAAASLPLGNVQAVPSGVSGPARCALYCKDLAGCIGYNFRSVPLSDGTQCQLYTATPIAYSAVAGCQYYTATESEMVMNTILVQQHIGGAKFFDRTWAEFKVGFGDVAGNYWIGNDALSYLTQTKLYKMRFDLQSRFNGQWYFAEYDTFTVGSEASGYALTFGGYRGDAGDALYFDANQWVNLSGAKFSTSDRDNDKSGYNCAKETCDNCGCGAGWWYIDCSAASINSPPDCKNSFTWAKLPLSDKKLLVTRMSLLLK